MKFNFVKNWKLFVIFVVVVLVAGMTMFGILGLNNSKEYNKNNQLNVTISQDVNDSLKNTQKTVKDYLASADINYSENKQVVDNGLTSIYTINCDCDIDVEQLKGNIESAINNNLIQVEVNYVQSTLVNNNQAVAVIVSLAIAVVAIFVYLFFVEKTASALTVIINSVIATILALSVISIARIPIYPFISIILAMAFAFTAILSSVVVNRFKEELKSVANSGKTFTEIANIGLNNSLFRIIFVSALLLITGIILSILCFNQLVFLALQLLVVIVVSIACTLFITPLVWANLKKVKSVKTYQEKNN